jgi:hypothetical protein
MKRRLSTSRSLLFEFCGCYIGKVGGLEVLQVGEDSRLCSTGFRLPSLWIDVVVGLGSMIPSKELHPVEYHLMTSLIGTKRIILPEAAV